jgi:hypothetical protein
MDMADTSQTGVQSVQAEIDRLEQQLKVLLSESPVMDDELNAVERDLEALRRKRADFGVSRHAEHPVPR